MIRLAVPLALLSASLAPGVAVTGDPSAQGPVSAALQLDRNGHTELWVGWKTPSGGRLESWPVSSGTPRSASRSLELPVAPDFLGIGDFNADGKLDLVIAERGGAAVWLVLRQDDGSYGPGAWVPLPGRVTSAVAGDVNRLDGLSDLVVAIESGGAASLQVFEDPHGVMSAAPESVPLPAAATDLAISMLDGDGFADIAAACGSEVVTVHGRDRMLGSGRADAVRFSPETTKSAAPFPVLALAVGRFGSASASPTRLAIADHDGRLAFSTSEGRWRLLETQAPPHAAALQLFPAKLTAFPGDDLLVFDRDAASLAIYAADPASTGGMRLVDRRGMLAGAILPVRVGSGGLSDLAVLGASGLEVARGTSSPQSVFVVNDAGDGSDAAPGDGLCATATATCTLRAAIQESNASPGADTVQFALGGGNPVIAPASALPAITEAVTLDGATGGATRVVLSGASAGAGANGLLLGPGSTASAVRSLVVRGFAAAGIRIEGANNVVENCYIGTDDAGGSGATGNQDGILLAGATANGNTIGGSSAAQRNVISHNAGRGIHVTSSAAPNTIAGNFIGLDASGSVAVPNANDVSIDETTASAVRVGGSTASPGTPPGNVIAGTVSVSSGSGDLIQGNLLGFDAAGTSALGSGTVSIFASANITVGGPTVAERNIVRVVRIISISSNAKVQGNYIGVDISGNVAVAGNGAGGAVDVNDGPSGTLIGGASTSFGAPPGNVIAGNATGSGVRVAQGALRNPTNAAVLGNIIGLNAAGTAALPSQNGVVAGSRGNVTLGGENSGEGNLVSGNSQDGVRIVGGAVTAKGNWIGTDLAGTAPLGNGGHGISTADDGAGGTPASVTIGGTAAGARNVIAGNALDGIRSGMTASLTVIGNRIGVGPSGLSLGNGGAGITCTGTGGSRSIGGSTGLTPGSCTGSCNLIANNGLDGVALSGVSSPIPIRGNVFRSNGDLGIDLDANGPTLNDPADGDSGSNGLQNFPLVTSRVYDGVNTTIQGTLSSAPSTGYTIDVYANTDKDPSGYGEGEVWLGSTTCTTNVSGSCSWSLVAAGSRAFIAATATSATGATSELSRAYIDDLDGDGVLNPADNCVDVPNPVQADADADGVGNLCDNCVNLANAAQTDTDSDGAGDACDCQPLDPTDRSPAEVAGFRLQKDAVNPNLTYFFWDSVPQADRYSITRGDLETLGASQFGTCAAEGIVAFEDNTEPAPGHGFFYLIAGQNFDCGLGSWGKLSNELERVNGNPAACAGVTVATAHASSENTVSGNRTGTFSNTLTSNNQYQSIQEILSGGSPSVRYSFLEHRWTFSVGTGTKELHAEVFRTASSDGDDFVFECSTDGTTWTSLAGPGMPFSDPNLDLSFSAGLSTCVPVGYLGSVMIRVVDTNHTPGTSSLDTVTIDEVFLRVVP